MKEQKYICPNCEAKFGSYDEVKEHSWYCGEQEEE